MTPEQQLEEMEEDQRRADRRLRGEDPDGELVLLARERRRRWWAQKQVDFFLWWVWVRKDPLPHLLAGLFYGYGMLLQVKIYEAVGLPFWLGIPAGLATGWFLCRMFSRIFP